MNILINENIEETFKSGYISDLHQVINHTKGFESFKEYDVLFSKEDPLIYLSFNYEKGLFLSIKDKKLKVYEYKKEDILNILIRIKEDLEKRDLYNHCEDVIKKYKVYLKSFEKSKFKEIKKGEKTIKEGDFLYTSWGYDQTNIEYFQVLKIIGKNYFIIREVYQYNDPDKESQQTYYNVLPTEEFLDLPIKAYISNDGYCSVCENGYKRSLYCWDKKSKYKTNSQFGH